MLGIYHYFTLQPNISSELIENAELTLVNDNKTTVLAEKQALIVIPATTEHFAEVYRTFKREIIVMKIKETMTKNVANIKKEIQPRTVERSIQAPFPDVDRSRLDHINILGVIMSVD